MTQTHRIKLSNQDLDNIKNALVFYANKLWNEPGNRPGQTGYANVKQIQSLALNFQHMLSGERRTGRRKNFEPCKDHIEGLKN